jgi:hypothetical protein
MFSKLQENRPVSPTLPTAEAQDGTRQREDEGSRTQEGFQPRAPPPAPSAATSAAAPLLRRRRPSSRARSPSRPTTTAPHDYRHKDGPHKDELCMQSSCVPRTMSRLRHWSEIDSENSIVTFSLNSINRIIDLSL